MEKEMTTFKGSSPRPEGVGDTAKSPAFDIQREVDEITEIMRVNMQNIVDREVKLTELDGRAATLNEKSKIFEKTTTKLKNKQFWKNAKWMIILAIIGIVLILIIALSIFFA